MIKFNLRNSVIGQEFKDVSFKHEIEIDGVMFRNLNLIYASNASGKSTFSSILENHFNNQELLVNRFTGEKSSLIITNNPNGIDKAYRYDRLFAKNSTEIYKNELIISPKNAQQIVAKNLEVDKGEADLLTAYKNSGIYKEIKKYSDILKVNGLPKLALKSFKMNHANDIYLALVENKNIIDECYQFSIEELIDFSILNNSFLQQCKELNDEALKIIKETFPNIDNIDANFYNEVYNYMKNFNDRVLDQICLMCGKTIITDEILHDRLDFIFQKITEYQNSLENNDFFKNLNEFREIEFCSDLFAKFQKQLGNLKNEELIQASLKIADKLNNINIEQIRRNGINCIISLIANDKQISKEIENLNKLTDDLKEIKKINKKIINADAKDRFVKNLKELQFKYFETMNVSLKDDGTIAIQFRDLDISEMYNEILSESEKSILSFSLFLAIIKDYQKSIILIDDPIDSHDQKNKWFILDKIQEYFGSTKSLVVILTHDLDVSKSLNMIESSIKYTNFILTKKELIHVTGPSLFFNSINNFVYDVKNEIEKSSCLNNEKYILPIGFLLRYLSKDQHKLLNEVDTHLPIQIPSLLHTSVITRKYTKQVGFKDVSNYFVHYSNSVDSAKLLNELFWIIKIKRKSTALPLYFCPSISTDLLLESIINDIGTNTQYDKDLVKILTAMLIRNIIEMKIINKINITTEKKISEYVDTYLSSYGATDELYVFYKMNKFMIDEFAHLESGVDALLTYDFEFIKDRLAELRTIL